MVACKKENQPTDNGTPVTSSQVSVHPEQIDDMNAYLDGYRQRMMEGAKDGEALTLADAQWLLTNLANQDFGNVVEQFDDIRFDDLSTSINIEDGLVSLPALNEAYKSIFGEIRAYYRSLDLQDKNCRFIKCTINPDGTVNTHVTLTYDNGTKDGFGYFYFDNEFDCWALLSLDSVYDPDSCAILEFNRIANHEYGLDDPYQRVYYTEAYDANLDPFNAPADHITPSPFYCDSRLYYANWPVQPLLFEEMAYLVDSYLGLIEDNKVGRGIVVASVEASFVNLRNKMDIISYHTLAISYGYALVNPNPPAVD